GGLGGPELHLADSLLLSLRLLPHHNTASVDWHHSSGDRGERIDLRNCGDRGNLSRHTVHSRNGYPIRRVETQRAGMVRNAFRPEDRTCFAHSAAIHYHHNVLFEGEPHYIAATRRGAHCDPVALLFPNYVLPHVLCLLAGQDQLC